MTTQRVAVALTALLLTANAFAHGGGLNKDGCHTNRKTGDYHCHGGASASPAPIPAERRSPPPQQEVPRTQLVSSTRVTSAPTSNERDLVRAAQVLLQALGYHPTLLGDLDERTQGAINGFARAENLPGDGRVTPYLLLRLSEKLAAKCD